MKIISPLLFARVFNRAKAHGDIYFLAAGLVAVAQVLFMTVDRTHTSGKNGAAIRMSSSYWEELLGFCYG